MYDFEVTDVSCGLCRLMPDGDGIGGLLCHLHFITKRYLRHTSASVGEVLTITRMESPNIHWHRPPACNACALNAGMTKYAPTPNYELCGHLLATFIPKVDLSLDLWKPEMLLGSREPCRMLLRKISVTLPMGMVVA